MSDEELNNIPSINFNLTKFDCLGYQFHCVLDERQIPVMKNFFNLLETSNLTWEESKEQSMSELLQIELPEYSKLHGKFTKRFYQTSRARHAFQQMESSQKVRDFILQISRDRKLNTLL